MSQSETDLDPLRAALQATGKRPTTTPYSLSRGGVARLLVAAVLSALAAFQIWELIDQRLRDAGTQASVIDDIRVVSSSLFTALVVGSVALWHHRRHAAALESTIALQARSAKASRTFLDVVFDASPVSLVLLDEKMGVVKANAAAERLHGGVPLIGRACHEALLGSHESCEHCPVMEGPPPDAPDREAMNHSDPRTGEILSVRGRKLELEDGTSYLLLVEESLTEQRKLEARLLHQEKMAAFGLLAAGIAHDMGNPLSSIGTQLQLVDDDDLPEEVRGVIGTVRRETERLQRILRELVDFARRRRDTASLVSVQSVVSDALRLLRHDHRMRDVKATEQVDADTRPVQMIEDHLMQVVLNLLINAVDAMPDGGDLRIEVRPAGERVVVRVHDSGSGMERSILDRCFEPLYTTKSEGKGTGLGLSICKDIVEAAGGTIEVHSAPAQGTTVIVSLPAAVLDDEQERLPRPKRIAMARRE